MDRIALAIGGLLIGVGVAGFAASNPAAPTALIPAYIGAALAICGLIVMAKPALRKHVMHAAATIALLGFLGCAMRLVKGLTAASPSKLAMASQAATAALCVLFVVLAVRSFTAAKRARTAGGAGL